jgi:hypothetical protein
MAKLRPTRVAQWPLVAEFTFHYDDTMVDTTGAETNFAATGTRSYDVINLPPNAVVLSGSVVTEVAVTGPTAYNVSVGDSANPTRYLAATDVHAAGITALVPTGYVGSGENIRITVNPTGSAATSGRVTVRVEYIIVNRANEVIPV